MLADERDGSRTHSHSAVSAPLGGPGVPGTGTHPVCSSHIGKSRLHSHLYPLLHEEGGHAGSGTAQPV